MSSSDDKEWSGPGLWVVLIMKSGVDLICGQF